jgi:DNA (cytosine-5)-methyltransferase 1
MVRGGRIDVAWVIHDAQYFGVAQRRRRLFAVCDFTEQRAAEILFKPKSLHGYFTQSGAEGKRTAPNASRSIDSTEPNDINTVAAFMGGQSEMARSIAYNEKISPTLKSGAGGNTIPCVCEPQVARTLTARGDSSPCIDRGQNVVVQPIICMATTQVNAECCNDLCPTITEAAGKSGNNKPYFVMGVNQNGDGDINTAETAYTLTTAPNASGRNAPLVCHPKITGTLCASGAGLSRPAGMGNETDLCVVTEVPIIFTHLGFGHYTESDKSKTLLKTDKIGSNDVVAYCLQKNEQAGIVPTSVDCRNLCETEEISGTLQAKSGGGYSLNYQNPVRNGFIVRRLTPVECERLQGYPDGWTEYGHDGKLLSDTARYQFLGNSVAIPCVAYVLSGIKDEFLKIARGE